MTEFLPMADAVEREVRDGMQVAMEGFSHLVPYAAAHEIIRQGRRGLRLARMTPDILADQLIGTSCVSELAFSWAGNPGIGSLHRFREAVERSWPVPLELDEHSHAGMVVRYAAGAARLPFGVLRAYRGTDLATHSRTLSWVTCPFTGEQVAAVAALNPELTIIHAQQADRDGNVMLWGIAGVQKEAALAADRVLVTVEEVVPELVPRPHAVVLPASTVATVVVAPGGAAPSYTQDRYGRDDAFHAAWDGVSRDRAAFTAWIGEHVRGAS